MIALDSKKFAVTHPVILCNDTAATVHCYLLIHFTTAMQYRWIGNNILYEALLLANAKVVLSMLVDLHT